MSANDLSYNATINIANATTIVSAFKVAFMYANDHSNETTVYVAIEAAIGMSFIRALPTAIKSAIMSTYEHSYK